MGDLRVTVLVAWGWALWHGGSPDQANNADNQALQHARQSEHPLTLAYALLHIGLTAVSGRRTTEVEELAGEIITISNEQRFTLILGWALMLQGWAMAQRRHGKDAVDRIRRGLNVSRATGSRAHEPIFLGLLAEALALAGATEEGLAVLADALAATEPSGARGHNAELHRLRGDFLGRLPSPDWTEVDGCFCTALAIARKQGTRAFELRAATSLARLRRDQDRRAEARDLLAPVYGWFTEGFDTPDLKEAKAMLDELA
jgi:predicted ATPase